MPEWLVEHGIGENRAALVEAGEIIETRIELEGVVHAGSVLRARLRSIGEARRNAVAAAVDGAEYLLPRGAGTAAQGAEIAIEVTREAIPGAEPWKRPVARLSDAEPVLKSGLDELAGRSVISHGPRDELGDAGWDELVEEARSGLVNFPGGELRLVVTPAMTVIDVDGHLESDELALAGARECARAIRRLDIGGSIGIDLPTVRNKDVRMSAAQAIDSILPQPFERTAVNGFGFVQVVRPRKRASLLELASDRPAFEARALLRQVSFSAPGGKTLVAHPSVAAVLQAHPSWLEALSRKLGGSINLRADGQIPMSAGYAEPA